MEKKSTLGLGASIRARALERLDTTLIIFELVLSVIFISLSYLTGSLYLKGIGIGLIIAWVTSALAYIIADYRKKKAKP